MNLSSWRRLENRIRKLAAEADSVNAVTGAIFAAVLRENRARRCRGSSELHEVVLVCKRGLTRSIAVIMTNAELLDRSLESFIAAVSELEKRTGLKFFPELDNSKPPSGNPPHFRRQ